jgi:adenylate cyclase
MQADMPERDDAQRERNAGLTSVRRWLASQALLASPVPRVAAGFADRLLQAGLPLWRAHLSVTTLDPEVEAIGLTWTREGRRLREEYSHGSFRRMSRDSPIYDAIVHAREAATGLDPAADDDIVRLTRYRLERGEGLSHYPVLAEFRAGGATDYLCYVMPFSADGALLPIRTGGVVTFAADRPGGFDDDEVAAISDLIPGFGAAVRIGIDLATIRTVLDTYLGRDVGRRVLSGEIRRGSVATISAAILFGDLRGFTALADTVPRDQLIAMLDDYLACLVIPIEAHDGQVLKFLGDGLLATFAFAAAEPGAVCAKALQAAAEALRRIEVTNEARRAARLPVTTLDIALHVGDVLYGNVGSDRRLDFTVIGPAVNEASRLEALCARLGVPLLASRSFVDAMAAAERFRSLGEQQLRGVQAAVEVFALA